MTPFPGVVQHMKSCPTCYKTYPTDFSLCPRDGAALVEGGEWSDGMVVRGKYQILGKLGRGGMGSVYRAKHLRFGELLALKVMSPELAHDPVFVKRFEQEAFITRKLQHPNAVRVDDIDETEDGRPYIVMELIEGRSLRDVIAAEGPLPAPRVCSIIKQVASALDAAHQLTMVHRDIKPDNILLIEGARTPPPQPSRAGVLQASSGEVAKVLDFGIAKLKEARGMGIETNGLTMSGTGMVIGTPKYMSPEQARGMKGEQLDGRSDVYSLGVVMYEMLTGDLPLKADTTMELLMAHVQTPPTPIQQVRPGLNIPEGIARIVMQCLEKNREHRPATAGALIQAIEQAEFTPPAPDPPRPDTVRALPGEPSGFGGIPPAQVLRHSHRSAPTPRPQPPAAPLTDNWRFIRWCAMAVGVVLTGVALWLVVNLRTGTNGPAKTEPSPSESVQSPTGGMSKKVQPETGTGVAPIPPTSAPADIPATGTLGSVSATPAVGKPRTTISSPKGPAVHTPPQEVKVEPAPGPGLPTASATEVAKQIHAAITEGDLFYENGEYDSAISAYQNGLNVSPTHPELLQKIQKARNAKATESGLR